VREDAYVPQNQLQRFTETPSWTSLVRADGLLVGCLLALLIENGTIRNWFQRHGPLIFWVSLCVFGFDIYRFQSVPPLHESVAVALMVGATLMRPAMSASRFLTASHLRTTGVMSYGIYLWQILFLNPRWGLFAYVLLPISVFASWFLIEQPSMALGRKIVASIETKRRRRAWSAKNQSGEHHSVTHSAQPPYTVLARATADD
jgi:peptidoglycan/LPS O-acetylase OafA/YrhL